MRDVQSGSSFPTTKVVASGFAAGFVAFVVALVALVAMTDAGMSEAMATALFIGSATVMVAIVVQTGILMTRGHR